MKVNHAFQKDVYNIFLSFIEEYIKDDKFKALRKQLAHVKYEISFSNRSFEKDIVNHDFNIADSLLLDGN